MRFEKAANIMFDKILKQIQSAPKAAEFHQKSKQFQQNLAQEVLEVVHKGVTIQVSADLQIVKIESVGRSDQDICDAVNQAIKEAQKIMQKKMRGHYKELGLNIPGL